MSEEHLKNESQAHRRWRIFWLCLMMAVGGIFAASAALVDLDAMVTSAIYQNDGVTPLANGSIVYIYGSGNSTIDPMQSFGTNLVAGSATGDDVVLGMVRIGDNVTSNGTFFTTIQYDSDQISYVYIRFFEWTNATPITGMVYWGQSSNHFLPFPPTLGVNSVDFSTNLLVASNYNNFIAIPEPSTANLIVLVTGMAWAMRASFKGRQPGKTKGDTRRTPA